MVLYSNQFILAKAQLFSCHSFIPPQINSLWSIQVCHLMLGSASLYLPSELHIYSFHTLTHSYLVCRSMVVGNILMVHTCSLMCTNHIDMIHTPWPFSELGSTLVRLLSHMYQYCPWGNLNSQHSGELLGKACLVQCTYPLGHTTSLCLQLHI